MAETLWIVTANAARARLYERHADGGLAELADLVHPQSRQSGRDLAADRPGRSELDLGDQKHGRTAYEPPTGVHEKEHERFARELAAHLDDAVAGARCQALVLLVAPAFLGELRQRLSDATAKAVRVSEAVDLTALPPHELRNRVDALLRPR
ncbi:MAG: host attachment protein [Burkholderiaceae bacterium]|jgi:protein required for attachment to host cells|nr:host attachment protein [Burkholderiaceae bacterium]